MLESDFECELGGRRKEVRKVAVRLRSRIPTLENSFLDDRTGIDATTVGANRSTPADKFGCPHPHAHKTRLRLRRTRAVIAGFAGYSLYNGTAPA